jgi:hypothetical protein
VPEHTRTSTQLKPSPHQHYKQDKNPALANDTRCLLSMLMIFVLADMENALGTLLYSEQRGPRSTPFTAYSQLQQSHAAWTLPATKAFFALLSNALEGALAFIGFCWLKLPGGSEVCLVRHDLLHPRFGQQINACEQIRPTAFGLHKVMQHQCIQDRMCVVWWEEASAISCMQIQRVQDLTSSAVSATNLNSLLTNSIRSGDG